MRRVMFSLMVSMLVLLGSVGSAQAAWFFDGFDYPVAGRLEHHAPWVLAEACSPLHSWWNVGPAFGSRTLLTDNWWGGRWTLMTAPGTNRAVPGAALASDYIVSLDTWSDVHSHFDRRHRLYLVGRYVPAVGDAPAQWVAARVTLGVNWPVSLSLRDSTGFATGDYYIADYVAGAGPVSLSLNMVGTTLTAHAAYAGFSRTLTRPTTIVNTGAPGFAACFPWGWTSASVDNFTVIPEPATMILLGLGLGFLGFKGLKKKKA